MAFSMDNIVFDRIQMAVAEDNAGNILYTITQLADATIDITAESKDAVDAQGTLIKRFYTGKQGTFTANNAIIDFNILASSTGSPKQVATTGAKIVMPRIVTCPKGTETMTLTGLKEGTVHVEGVAANGTRVESYTMDVTAGEDKFGICILRLFELFLYECQTTFGIGQQDFQPFVVVCYGLGCLFHLCTTETFEFFVF